MAKKSKQMRAALEKIDSTKAYSVEEAVALAQETNFAKFDATVEVSYNLNIDVKKADQQIRGARVLPKLKQQVLTSLVKTNSLLKSTVDGLTLTLLLQHQI